MVKVVYNNKLVYKVVISMVFEISLWKEKESLKAMNDLTQYNTLSYIVKLVKLCEVVSPDTAILPDCPTSKPKSV